MILISYFLMRRMKIPLRVLLKIQTRADVVKSLVFGIGCIVALVATILILPSFGAKAAYSGFQTAFLQTAAILAIVAVSEEFIYRGFILNMLKQSMNIVKAVIISAVVFACFHIFVDALFYQSITAMISQFSLGIVTAIVYLISKNVLYSMLVHWVSDFATFSFVSISPGIASVITTLMLMIVPLLLVTALYPKNGVTVWLLPDASYKPPL